MLHCSVEARGEKKVGARAGKATVGVVRKMSGSAERYWNSIVLVLVVNNQQYSENVDVRTANRYSSRGKQ